MKRVIKTISVVLCVLTLFLSLNILSFATDETILSETALSDGAETAKTSREESGMNTDDMKNENSDAEYSGGVQIGEYYFIRPYDELLSESFNKAVDLLGGIVTTPSLAVSACFALPPFVVLAPLALPAGIIYGMGQSVVGVFAVVFSPVTALINFLF